MPVYLGNDKRRITYHSEPVYFGGQKIDRIYAGSHLIYPDTIDYSYAYIYSFPPTNKTYGGDHMADVEGFRMRFNKDAEITDAVFLSKYEEEWAEAVAKNGLTYDCTYVMAAKGRNIASAKSGMFLSYYGKIFFDDIDSEGNTTSGMELVSTNGDISVYTTPWLLTTWPTAWGTVGTTLTSKCTSDLRILHSEDEYEAFIEGN